MFCEWFYLVQLDKKLGDQIILADFGGFLVIGDFFGRQYCPTVSFAFEGALEKTENK